MQLYKVDVEINSVISTKLTIASEFTIEWKRGPQTDATEKKYFLPNDANGKVDIG